jgi:predicted Zn-dependent protease
MGVSNQDAEIEVDVSTFSNIELIKKGEEYTENLELEKAVQIYDEGLRRFPNDTVIMDAYTDLLLQMDQTQKAREIIERSIQLNPNKEGLKYLNFAEMLRGHESL